MARFNLEGWKVGEWIKGNKELLKVVVPALITFAVTNNWIDSTVAGIIAKPLLDIVEYFIKK